MEWLSPTLSPLCSVIILTRSSLFPLLLSSPSISGPQVSHLAPLSFSVIDICEGGGLNRCANSSQPPLPSASMPATRRWRYGEKQCSHVYTHICNLYISCTHTQIIYIFRRPQTNTHSYIYVPTQTHIHTHRHIQTHKHRHLHTFIYIYIYVYIIAHTHTRTCIYNPHTCTLTDTHTHTQTHPPTHTHTHTHFVLHKTASRFFKLTEN